MIPVTEAKQLILQNAAGGRIAMLSLIGARGCVLAQTVVSPVDTPPFDQSAMDGYAFSFDEWDKKSDLVMTGEVPAGKYAAGTLYPSETVRIYTGAPLPAGADTVVIQERVIADGNAITIDDDRLVKGSNVRLQGSQTKKGETVLFEGQLLTPAAISFLASMGISKVGVFSKPMVGIIVTGKELAEPGDVLREGKIFESNSYGLVSALEQLGIKPSSVEILDDDETVIRHSISAGMKNDILIITGGISTGDHDHVAAALDACGVDQVFHNVRQKPGRPFYFGRTRHTLVFALPGNPAAALTCFYEYIVPVIGHFTKQAYFKKLQLPLASEYRKKAGMTYFLRGRTGLLEVEILNDQESYKMNSFALADCIIELEAVKEFYKKGDLVHVSMII